MINFIVSIDNEEFDHKPDTRQYKDYVDKYGQKRTEVSVLGARIGTNVEELNIEKLSTKISAGNTWSPFTFKVCPDWGRRRRLEGLFDSSQVFALDFDNNESKEHILALAQKYNINIALIHTSFSSTQEFTKSRAILLCDEPIKDFDLVKKISIALSIVFDSDKSCVDVARLYFGSNSNSVSYLDKNAINTKKKLLEIAESQDVEKYLVNVPKNLIKDDEIVWGDLKMQQEIFSKISKKKLNSIKRKIKGILNDIASLDETQKRPRYDCVWKNTSRLARMPELTGKLVYDLISEAINNNEYFDDWEHDKDNTIKSAILWSANHADEPF